MNRSYIIASSLAVAVFAAFAQDAATTISANATLKDGSSVKGEFCTERVTGSTIFTEELRLDPAIVKSLAFTGTNGESKVELKNGDKFAMTVANESFKIKSMLGELAIPRANFRALSLSARKTATGGSDEGLVFYCTFDDEAAITSPAIGPVGTICSREFVDGKANRALRVPRGSSAGFFTLPQETFGKEGCIEFWAKIEPSRDFFRDCDPRIIFIKSPAGWFTVEYSSNNGGGHGGFCIRCFNYEYIKGGSCGSYRYSDFLKDIAAWHHYAFSWTEDVLTIFIDGVKLDGAFKTGDGRINEEKLQSGPSIMGLPNDNKNPYNTEPNTPFVIDELKIWNHAKIEFDL